MRGTGKTIAIATLVAGTLDIAFAMILTLIFGRHIPDMLRFVASGPFTAATEMGTGGAILGLVVHYALMAIMVAVFVAIANHKPALTRQPVRWGVIYGLVTYVVMNLVVVPLRFGNWPPKPLSIVTQLFAHVVLVGIPIALITTRTLRPQRN